MEVLTEVDEVRKQLLQELNHFSGESINSKPTPDSWCAGQVAEHLIKSTGSIAQFIRMDGERISRPADERVEELKSIFLDFSRSFQAPEFIVPTRLHYALGPLTTEVDNTYNELLRAADNADLNETVSHKAFGKVSKLEILYFVLFHTQRHIQQIKRIEKTIK
ncbi:MAG: DinB family protein [Chitinophagales bacterium]